MPRPTLSMVDPLFRSSAVLAARRLGLGGKRVRGAMLQALSGAGCAHLRGHAFDSDRGTRGRKENRPPRTPQPVYFFFKNKPNRADRVYHMAQPGWHGGRLGSRGRRSAWSGRGSRVWTPGSASALRTAAPTTAPPPAPAAATAAVAPAPTSSPTTPALKARTR